MTVAAREHVPATGLDPASAGADEGLGDDSPTANPQAAPAASRPTHSRVELQRRMQQLIDSDGPWTSHNIRLAPDLYTLPGKPLIDQLHVRRVLQAATDLVGKPIDQTRVLDLACLEGQFGLEFALHGAKVLGIEGREASVKKANFSREALGLTNIEFRQGDVRDLSVASHGHFDIVLCLGILYHLDWPAVHKFIESIFQVCTRVAVFHTHIANGPALSFDYQGHAYYGRRVMEFLSTEKDRKRAYWGSLDNDMSFWYTRASLINALQHVGFATVFETRVPFLPIQPFDHVTLVAVKSEPVRIRTNPEIDTVPAPDYPEHQSHAVHPSQFWWYPLARRMKPLISRMGWIKPLLGSQWHRMNR